MDLIKKRILITGSNGKVGKRLVQKFSENALFEIHTASLEENSLCRDVEYTQLDISKKNQVKALFHKFFPDLVINAAGYTNVDLCETNKELSWSINVKGTENIAMSSWAIDAHIIHISSDYVFDGKEGPYTEEDIPHPISYYGRTKLAAENTLRSSGARFSVVRSNVLYGAVSNGSPDFVRWVIESLRENKQIKIVTDQINNPTYIGDLIDAIESIGIYELPGIYNIGGAELLSRYEFCLRIAEYFKLKKELILPVTTKELNQPALRPLNSGLIIKKAESDLHYLPRSIEDTFLLIKEELGY